MEATQILSFRSRLGKITKQVPALHRFLVAVYHTMILEIWPRLRLSSLLGGRRSCVSGELDSFLSLQAIRVLSLKLRTPEQDSDLIAALQEESIPFVEGGWTIYLPPSDKLKKNMPEIAEYPSGSGVKILRHLLPPLAASYTPNHLRPTPGATHVRARTPSPQELLRIAGKLSADGIGPVVHDLVELKIGDTRATAFIIEHVFSNSIISGQEHAAFVSRLDALLERGIIGIAHGDHRFSMDFRAPDCNGNLLKGEDGRTLYVDFQSFNYRDEKMGFLIWAQKHGTNILFGPRRLGKNSDYLYQMIPGVGEAKRETMVRWDALDALIQEAGIGLDGCISFDIGCNSGLMSYYALSRGAKWAYGWDQPDIAAASQKLLRLLGASRWKAFGAEISADTDFCSFLPNEANIQRNGVLLYLAISNHIGFPMGVADLPWKYCIYEGHSNQDVKSSIDKIKRSGWARDIQILATGVVRDGDSPTRAMVIFSRE